MKVTDYCPRAAPFDSYLTGRDLIGVEIGVDVGAHAEALLTYCPVAMLFLVDIWPNPRMAGICEGRLWRFGRRTEMVARRSVDAAAQLGSAAPFDFVYVDQEQGAESVAADLRAWWPLLKRGGALGHRNYTDRDTPLDRAVDAFVAEHGPTRHVETGEIVLIKT